MLRCNYPYILRSYVVYHFMHVMDVPDRRRCDMSKNDSMSQQCNEKKIVLLL